MKTIRTTCPCDCYDSCGMIVELKGNEIVRVKGDPSHPLNKGRLCGKCTIAYNGVWLDPTKRLTEPLKRIGKKGEGKFISVSWDKALNDIRDQINDILTNYGGQSIFHTHYSGTNSLIAKLFPNRFFIILEQ